MQPSIKILTTLYLQLYNEAPKAVIRLPQSGSERIYFRLTGNQQSVIGAFNADQKENETFFSFTQTFNKLNIRVPKLLQIATDRQHYLLSDLGDETLFNRIKKQELNQNERPALCVIKNSLQQLIAMQIKGGESIDFSKCYPRERFDRQSILWDLNYFKYEFLKLTGVPFDEQNLENDFTRLSDFLLQTPSDYFMFRDFQSRNIMVINNEPWVIDYQGGRKGPLQYDLASLLFSPKTQLTDAKRDVLLDYYILNLKNYRPVDEVQFKKQYYGFALIRILQALGAYGFRGIFEKKSNFKNNIPDAIHNLKYLFENHYIEIELPEIEKIIHYLSNSKWAEKYTPFSNKLTISVTSFSYKKEIPDDPSENGGGFVFDCRGLPNPGRYTEYKTLNGLDQTVIVYLEKYESVIKFQENARNLVEISIQEYLKRGFNHLCVNFGCTGGQHRSVYHAEKFSTWVQNNFPVEVVLIHTEKNNWKKDE